MSKNGTILEVAESKFNTSKLSKGQDAFFKDKEPGVFGGVVADDAGLKGLTVDPSTIKLSEYRWEPNGTGTIINH